MQMLFVGWYSSPPLPSTPTLYKKWEGLHDWINSEEWESIQ